MFTAAGGPIWRWSHSTDRELGNVSGVGSTGIQEAGFSDMLLPTKIIITLLNIIHFTIIGNIYSNLTRYGSLCYWCWLINMPSSSREWLVTPIPTSHCHIRYSVDVSLNLFNYCLCWFMNISHHAVCVTQCNTY